MTDEQQQTQEDSTTAAVSLEDRAEKPRLQALDGYRFFVAFWLVIAHNYNSSLQQQIGIDTVYQRFCLRRYVAVTFFLVLSGFVSQYSYGSRDFNNSDTLRKFYVGRFGSIMACYYATTALALVLRALGGHYTTTQWIVGVPLVLTLLQCWFPAYSYFGNTPGWTMSTLAAHWVAFPFLQRRLMKMTDSRIVEICVVLMPILALIPVTIALVLEGGYLYRSRAWFFFYTFPPFRFPEFVLGAGLAELFVRGHRPKVLAKLSDLVFPICFCMVLVVPFVSRKTMYDSLMIYLTMPLFGLLVYGSSCDPSSSYTAKFFSLNICRRLGDFAFQVYLWRWPIFEIALRFQDGYWRRGHMYLTPAYFFPSLIVLYAFSYGWYLFVDNPLRLYLSKVTGSTPPPNVELVDVESSKKDAAPPQSTTEQGDKASVFLVVDNAASGNSNPDPTTEEQPYKRMEE